MRAKRKILDGYENREKKKDGFVVIERLTLMLVLTCNVFSTILLTYVLDGTGFFKFTNFVLVI